MSIGRRTLNWHFRRCIERGISMHRKVCFDASVSSKRCIEKKRCIAFPKNDASKKTMHRNILFDASKKKRCIDNQIIDFPKKNASFVPKRCIVIHETMHRYCFQLSMHRYSWSDASLFMKRCIDNQIIDFPKKRCIVCAKTMHRYTWNDASLLLSIIDASLCGLRCIVTIISMHRYL